MAFDSLFVQQDEPEKTQPFEEDSGTDKDEQVQEPRQLLVRKDFIFTSRSGHKTDYVPNSSPTRSLLVASKDETAIDIKGADSVLTAAMKRRRPQQTKSVSPRERKALGDFKLAQQPGNSRNPRELKRPRTDRDGDGDLPRPQQSAMRKRRRNNEHSKQSIDAAEDAPFELGNVLSKTQRISSPEVKDFTTTARDMLLEQFESDDEEG